MRIVFGGPVEVVGSDLLPAAIFSETVFRSDEVKIREHATGDSFVQPHRSLCWIFGRVAPAHDASGVGSGDVGRDLAALYSTADAALQSAPPNRGIVVCSALIIG